MLSPEKNRLAAEAMECWADFQDGLSSHKRKYPIQQFKAFWAVAKRYAELTRSDPLIHRSLAGAVNGLTISLKWSESVYQARFFGMRSVWSASSLAVMTRTSREMNHQGCEASPPGSHVKCGSPNFSQTGLSDSD